MNGQSMALGLEGAPVLVVGAGIMGAGIAQVAAQAGHPVWLFDLREGAAAVAKGKLAGTLDALVNKGRLDGAAARAALARISPVTTLQAAADARLVVEAIVEQLEAKRILFAQLEAVLADDAVLATNTSSISITAIANGLARPGRLVGMHFFNPVPSMKLVEVVSGLQTLPSVAEAIFALSKAWGKVPVHARSTPGFIVNRIARPYYAEALMLLREQAATPQALDACLRAAGFRMGPCELMDLIGHDTNLAVTQSVFAANFFDRRYQPSVLQREMVDGGLLGRKSGQGFYRHPQGAPAVVPAAVAGLALPLSVVVHGRGAMADTLADSLERALAGAVRAAPGIGDATVGGTALQAAGCRDIASDWTGLTIDGARLMLTDGRTATEMASLLGQPDVAVFDRFEPLAKSLGKPAASAAASATGPAMSRASAAPPVSAAPPAAVERVLAFAVAEGASARWREQAPAWLAGLGFLPLPMLDLPGLVVARTLAMLINEAADAVAQAVCSAEGADAAMKLGVNYPRGPFEWLEGWSANGVVGLLDAMDAHDRGERYRANPWLRRQALVQRQDLG